MRVRGSFLLRVAVELTVIPDRYDNRFHEELAGDVSRAAGGVLLPAVAALPLSLGGASGRASPRHVELLCHNDGMGVDVRVERSAPVILQVLRDLAPNEAGIFEAEFREALRQASASFDLVPVDRVLNRWWGIAHLRLNPPSVEEREIARRLRAGEDVCWASPQERLAARGR